VICNVHSTLSAVTLAQERQDKHTVEITALLKAHFACTIDDAAAAVDSAGGDDTPAAGATVGDITALDESTDEGITEPTLAEGDTEAATANGSNCGNDTGDGAGEPAAVTTDGSISPALQAAILEVAHRRLVTACPWATATPFDGDEWAVELGRCFPPLIHSPTPI
jgi:hypothetical protein